MKTLKKTETSLLGYNYELVEIVGHSNGKGAIRAYQVYTYLNKEVFDITDAIDNLSGALERFGKMITTLKVIHEQR